MKRSEGEWLACPILGALGLSTVGLGTLGLGALLAGQGCGRVESGVEEPETEEAPLGATRPSVGAAGQDMLASTGTTASANTVNATGGSAGAILHEPAGTGAAGAAGASGDAASSDAVPLPYCVGIEGALLEGASPEDHYFGLEEASATAFCGSKPGGYLYFGLCLPAPAAGASCADTYRIEDVAAIYECGYTTEASEVCGPAAPLPGGPGCTGNECCYVLAGGCAVGRPFMVDGNARRATPVQGTGWLAPGAIGAIGATDTVSTTPDVASLDADTRRALADAYTIDALGEHASIASFARFVLECLALGAPADIVQEAQRALGDEIEHARSSFALATAYAGTPVGPSPLDVSQALPAQVTLEDCVRRAVSEGCIAETVSAALIHAAAEAAEDIAVKTSLARVADDERRHAVLAWRFVSWALKQDPSLLDLVRAEFARAPEHVGFGALTLLPGDARAMRAHGYLSVDERRRVAKDTLALVVLPSAKALELSRQATRGTRFEMVGARYSADVCASPQRPVQVNRA